MDGYCDIHNLGERHFASPLKLSTHRGDGVANFIADGSRVMVNIVAEEGEEFDFEQCFEQAGPREKVFFDPRGTRAAIVTCGGLSPGLNNVIRSAYMEFHHHYGIRDVVGFQYGYRGINPEHGNDPVFLTEPFVRHIHDHGGSVLGSSRGAEDTGVMVDRLIEMEIDMLLCVGGDGTLRGAHAIHEEVTRRGQKIAVIGVPKTIDNDIPFVYKTFGFDTAVGVAKQAIEGAHVEARGTPNGIGIVKVMGRDSGFIAAYATLASGEVNFCLVPEVPFDFDGPGGFLSVLEERVVDRGHAVIVVAEGAGQHLFGEAEREKDASGNTKHHDIGRLLRERIRGHFNERGIPHNLKYIDPSYMIRSVRANASDAIFSNNLARHAVHAGMAGKTDVVIGLWHGRYTHVPLPMVVGDRKTIRPESYLWRDVLATTGQPTSMRSG